MLQYLLENLTILKEESIRRSEKQSSVYESVQSICASQEKTGLHAQQFWTNWKTIQNTAHSESHWVFSLDIVYYWTVAPLYRGDQYRVQIDHWDPSC